eukprot:Skav210415  [mRNA]  locus=scaffold1573:49056:51464:- [translate_table: standard]
MGAMGVRLQVHPREAPRAERHERPSKESHGSAASSPPGAPVARRNDFRLDEVASNRWPPDLRGTDVPPPAFAAPVGGGPGLLSWKPCFEAHGGGGGGGGWGWLRLVKVGEGW